MKENNSHRKGCALFVMHISRDKGKDVEDAKVLSMHPVLQQFQDVFSIDISYFPPNKEVDFSIELVPGEALASKAP